ncbi:hypothetical protein VAPA_1c44640 [Variovorax paradoxus B4]|uniref:Uncharacterized protein n=1 Tax=Variovorax paradoxus B4 TaxID=1246301 RepID=T1XF27_VARPD|nr:SIR2 family protein [Variovorax paradoxus]AGU51537.1 hypothetical protein VAPA_1c44640 [Variovorax paradoxus B4]
MNSSETEKALQLPDYAALKKLAAGLWRQDNSSHGAAIMVGAGFSRVGAVTLDGKKKLPLWIHLSQALSQDLNATGAGDPLRLAEEYQAYFGKPALHDLIKREINDGSWLPGDLHKDLLKLPWTDVLTTNWDSLLERGAWEVMEPAYNVVSKAEDLANSRSPRIIKLHGTVNLSEELIFTQEDYRKYPESHAAFVNLARQIFIENELCLLGFSGDDPNFLQWAGWVRDKLSAHARRIYLVGPLNLTASRRRYLESINIAPIDLGAIVSEYDDLDTKHLKSTEVFLEILTALKPKAPWDWAPRSIHRSLVSNEELDKTHKDEKHAATLLERQLSMLISDRESYPGWVICPGGIRFPLQTQICDPYPSLKIISALSEDVRAKLLYEIAWRHTVSFELAHSWLAEQFYSICNPAVGCALTKRQQMEVALLLLKRSSWFDDESSQKLAKDVLKILEDNVRFWPEIASEIALHQAREARDRLDFSTMENKVESVAEIDPVQKLQKAAILAECGRFEEGEKLVKASFRELSDQYRNSRNSIFVLSRLAWATWLLRGSQRWSSEAPFDAFSINYQEAKCNPWDCMEQIQDRITKAAEKQNQNEINPSFEPGRYTDNSKNIHFSNEIHPILLFQGIADSIGIPLRLDGVSFLVDKAARLVKLDGIDDLHRFSLAIRAADSDSADSIKHVFSRVQMARISPEVANELLARCMRAVDYWKSKLVSSTGPMRGTALNKLRVFMEVLARAMVRASSDQAKQAFSIAMEIGKDGRFRHIWLVEALGHLIEYSLQSIRADQHKEILLEALNFPLQSEINLGDFPRWPDPAIKKPGERGLNPTLDRRIDEIIEKVGPCSKASASALLRLLPLIAADFLTEVEKEKCARMIWGCESVGSLVPETGLFKSALLELPSPDVVATRSVVRTYLFERMDDSLYLHEVLASILNASNMAIGNEFPSEAQAINYFQRLTEWRPKNDANDYFDTLAASQRRISLLIGDVLARSVVPSLPSTELTKANFERLLSFCLDANSPRANAALVFFAPLHSENSAAVKKIIKGGLGDQDSLKVACSSYALLKWRELRADEVVDELISRLVYLVETMRSPGLPVLLWTANQMVKNNWLNSSQLEVLTDAVPVIFDGANYNLTAPVSRDAVSVSLLRAACVKLARELIAVNDHCAEELMRVMEEAKADPLPEVRFAEISTE